MRNPGRWLPLLLGFGWALTIPATAMAQTPLTPFASFSSSPNSLIQYPDGNFYGTSGSGTGSTFFRMTPAGTMTVLHTSPKQKAGGG